MYKRMLVPLDGSSMSEVVFPYACQIGARLKVGLDFLHVCRLEDTDTLTMRRAYIEHMVELADKEPDEMPGRNPARRRKKRIPSTGQVVIGFPPNEILRYAEENKDDIIMMATHGRSGLKRWAIGSVSFKITHRSKKPVWLVRAGVPEEIIHDELPVRTTLVLLDGSGLAESSLPHLVALSRQRGTRLIKVCLLMVNDPAHLSSSQNSLMSRGLTGLLSRRENPGRQELERNRKASETYLKGVVERLKAENIEADCQILEGSPGEEIVKYVANNSIQLIVMATYGHAGIDRLVYSSTVEKVLLGVHTPIFLVPSPEETQDHRLIPLPVYSL
jgi:nucleotide-binding universal stress UspA family protein